MPNSVTPSIPLKTAVPSERRISAPATEANTSGRTPKTKANDVIRIGRSRSRDASCVTSKTGRPCSWSWRAYSTTRIAFLQASPTSTTSPICTKIFTSRAVYSTPATEQSKHKGTTRITAKGRVQLSYRAARAMKTQRIESMKT